MSPEQCVSNAGGRLNQDDRCSNSKAATAAEEDSRTRMPTVEEGRGYS